MGKKKEYYVSELYLKPEESTNTEKAESFTVKDYDAIADEVVKEQTNKPLNADPKKDGLDNDISSDVRQTDTQDNENDVVNEQPIKQLNADPGKDGVDGDISSDPLQTETKDLPIANEVVNDQPCEQLNEDPVKDEIDDDDSSSGSHQTDTQAVISDTNAIEPVSYKKLNDAEEDNQLKNDVNSQSTAIIEDVKSNLDTGASTKQASATESSNLKAAEKFTSIELGEIKYAPKNSPAINWFKRNRFCVIGIVIIVGLITVISIAASSRKKPAVTKETPLTSTTKSGINDEFLAPERNPILYFDPDTVEIDNTQDFNTKTSSTYGGINGNTIAASTSTTYVSYRTTTTTNDELNDDDETDNGSTKDLDSSGDGQDDPGSTSLLFKNV